MSDGETYGSQELCAWRVAPSIFWSQTTEPQFSRKLEKREDVCRLKSAASTISAGHSKFAELGGRFAGS